MYPTTAKLKATLMNDYTLVKDHAPPKFVGIDDLMEKIRVHQREMDLDRSQYLIFGKVNPDAYHAIQKHRDEHGPKLLFTYFSAIETLIIKIPNAPHESVHRSFGFLSQQIQIKAQPTVPVLLGKGRRLGVQEQAITPRWTLPSGRILSSRSEIVSRCRLSKRTESGG